MINFAKSNYWLILHATLKENKFILREVCSSSVKVPCHTFSQTKYRGALLHKSFPKAEDSNLRLSENTILNSH